MLGISTESEGVRPSKRNPVEEIEAEIQLLEWHKLANQAALKAALMRNKKLKASDQHHRRPQATVRQKAAWMQQVVEEEQARPLEVTQDYIVDYEHSQNDSAERRERDMRAHIASLRKLRDNITSQNDTRQRINTYRTWKKEVAPKRDALRSGRIPDQSTGERRANGAPGDATDPEAEAAKQRARYGTLANVLNSVDKLQELQERIASLERDSAAVRLEKHVSGEAPLSFKRKLTEPQAKQPRRAVYTVKVQKPKRNVPLRPVRAPRARRAPPGRQQRPEVSSRRAAPLRPVRGPGTRRPPLAGRQVRGGGAQHARTTGHAETGSARGSSTRAALRTYGYKAGASARRVAAATQKRKARTTTVARARPGRRAPVVRAKKGASAGRREKTRHMQNFRDLQTEHQRRKQALLRKLRASPIRPGATALGSGTMASRTAPGGGRADASLTRRTRTKQPTRRARTQAPGGRVKVSKGAPGAASTIRGRARGGGGGTTELPPLAGTGVRAGQRPKPDRRRAW